MGLWERVSDKREQHRQRQRDTTQDQEIKQLKEDMDKIRNGKDDRRRDNDSDGSRGGGGGRRDDVGYALEHDSRMIQRMYDDMYGRMGNRFAQGDGKEYAL